MEEKQKHAEKWAVLDDLYRALSGQLSQKVKITFETYVQQYYFKQVIAAANKRLTQMTDGMFVLRLKEEARDRRSQSGLDLDVLDRATGQWRDVTTLSGGESFLASLSLALGLSDVVQSESGGIRLETMFIDEGFGTLDENALRSALDLLSSLADRQTDDRRDLPRAGASGTNRQEDRGSQEADRLADRIGILKEKCLLGKRA